MAATWFTVVGKSYTYEKGENWNEPCGVELKLYQKII